MFSSCNFSFFCKLEVLKKDREKVTLMPVFWSCWISEATLYCHDLHLWQLYYYISSFLFVGLVYSLQSNIYWKNNLFESLFVFVYKFTLICTQYLRSIYLTLTQFINFQILMQCKYFYFNRFISVYYCSWIFYILQKIWKYFKQYYEIFYNFNSLSTEFICKILHACVIKIIVLQCSD